MRRLPCPLMFTRGGCAYRYGSPIRGGESSLDGPCCPSGVSNPTLLHKVPDLQYVRSSFVFNEFLIVNFSLLTEFFLPFGVFLVLGLPSSFMHINGSPM